jgi:predicted nuclease of predicted toxin-antitoxin system
VKLLLDENFSSNLIAMLGSMFAGSKHVRECGLGRKDDSAVWDYAKANGFTIVSKDSDFYERSLLTETIPKIIWLRLPNCSTNEIAELLRSAHPLIADFIEKRDETCLELGRAQKKK